MTQAWQERRRQRISPFCLRKYAEEVLGLEVISADPNTNTVLTIRYISSLNIPVREFVKLGENKNMAHLKGVLKSNNLNMFQNRLKIESVGAPFLGVE